jgi:paraquat-inducible protein A
MKDKASYASAPAINASHAEVIVCHGCDHYYDSVACKPGYQLNCRYCGTVLKATHENWLSRAAAFTVAGLVLFLVTVTFPFLGLEAAGQQQLTDLLTGILALLERDQFLLASLVFVTIVLLPLAELLGLSYVIIGRWFGLKLPGLKSVLQLLFIARPWNMMEIFFISVLITTIKLGDIASLLPGVGLYAFAALILVLIYTHMHLDRHALWEWLQHENRFSVRQDEALAVCHCCDALVGESLNECPRCRSTVRRRIPDSTQRTFALLVAATLLYFPANMLPIMTTVQLGQERQDTILSGVVHLFETGNYGIAAIVFVASILVPIAKIAILAYLLWAIRKKAYGNPKRQTFIYRVTEFVGRWSMIDVFVVTLLVAMVQFGVLANIEPNSAIVCFAAVVILTMLAAETFDPRLLWDAHNDQ